MPVRRIGNGAARWVWVLAIGLGVVLIAPGQAPAQELPGLPGGPEAESAPVVEPTSPAAIAARLAAVSQEIAAVESALARAQPPVAKHLGQVRDGLRAVETLLKRQAELATPAAAEGEKAAADDAGEPSPFALFALYEAQYARERSPDALADSRQALARAKDQLSEAEQSRRKARSEWEKAEAADKPRAERILERRRLDSRAAQETVYLRTLETRAAQQAYELQEATDASGDMEAMRERLARGEGDASAGFTALAERVAELRRSREVSERRLATAELLLSAAQKRFSQQAEPSSALLLEVEARTAHRDAIAQEIALVDAQVDRLTTQRSVWQQWDALLRGGGSDEELSAWEATTSERIESLKQAELQRRGRASDLQQRLEALEARLGALPKDAGVRAALVEEADTLRRLHTGQLAEIAALESDQRLSLRLLDDIHARTGHIDPLEYVARGGAGIRDIWTYEITVIEDSPITVGSVLLALAFFGIGLWASRRGSAFVGRLVQERLKLDEGAANALQTLSFYALLVSFTLLALRAVHFPLTAFTVLGGALAIGIGFGSQNVMNNFISGLILMLERPVRVRDVVEVEGNHGTIERIGARSTQIRSTDGRHMVVPNSFFLENNVINWTLSDELIRAKVTVGVIYGSPTRLVEERINQVVLEDERVLKSPQPVIIFEEFGDNSLNFDVYFWVRARSPMDVRKVQSQVRFRIDDLFREDELVIAFPQRDVHLDSVKPIEVRLLHEGDAATQKPTRSDPDDL